MKEKAPRDCITPKMIFGLCGDVRARSSSDENIMMMIMDDDYELKWEKECEKCNI